jgi:hypothetical protein
MATSYEAVMSIGQYALRLRVSRPIFKFVSRTIGALVQRQLQTWQSKSVLYTSKLHAISIRRSLNFHGISKVIRSKNARGSAAFFESGCWVDMMRLSAVGTGYWCCGK